MRNILASLSSVSSISLGLTSQPPEPSPGSSIASLGSLSGFTWRQKQETWHMKRDHIPVLSTPKPGFLQAFPISVNASSILRVSHERAFEVIFSQTPSSSAPIYSSLTFSEAHIQSPRSSQFSPPVRMSPWSESFWPGLRLHSLLMDFPPLLDKCFLIKGARMGL